MMQTLGTSPVGQFAALSFYTRARLLGRGRAGGEWRVGGKEEGREGRGVSSDGARCDGRLVETSGEGEALYSPPLSLPPFLQPPLSCPALLPPSPLALSPSMSTLVPTRPNTSPFTSLAPLTLTPQPLSSLFFLPFSRVISPN
ncbi:hypothetical protein E2C01_005728 [Portunus trituberculatus]|uniref:Uncharacterized protein n=1 Tax=Portunus trituberculatus TaxID=210409 RepID=A0A5B7CU67_PORTR|nr:hypothetical protein [Portunus trituberculatus]